MSRNTVLIGEGVTDTSDMIALHLADIPDIEIIQVQSGEQALNVYGNGKVDLIILDISLPNMNGYTVLKKVRENANTPVVIVSSKTEDDEKIFGLNLGADDYMSKPFNPLELVARIKAQLRRLQTKEDTANGSIRAGKLILNVHSCTVTKDGTPVNLTYTEFKLLKHFMDCPMQVFSKQQLFHAIWQEDTAIIDNTIMVFINKLRKKIEDDPKNPQFIKTVRGMGYRFETE